MKKMKISEMNEETRKAYKKKRWMLVGMYVWLIITAAAYMILFFKSAEGKVNIPGYTESAKKFQLFVGFLLLILPPIVGIISIEPELRKMRRPAEADDYGDNYVGDAEMDAYEQVFEEKAGKEKEELKHDKLHALRIRRKVYAGICVGAILMAIFSLNRMIHEIFLVLSIFAFIAATIALVAVIVKIVFEKAKRRKQE